MSGGCAPLGNKTALSLHQAMTWGQRRDRTRGITPWTRLRSTYWFVPSIMTAAAVGIAFAAIAIDRTTVAGSPWAAWAYGGGAEGARALLSTVAGSAITVISLTLSITIVALTVSAQHYGPRLLASFMRDTAAQIVLGMFIGTFAFCLVVLRTVHGDGDGFEPFVPHVSVTVAVAMAMGSIAALIYYIHHVAASLQVSRITSTLTRDLETAIDRLYPEEAGDERERAAATPPQPPDDAVAVAATSSGYVQSIDLEAMVLLAGKTETVVWLCVGPGDFVIIGNDLALVSPRPADSAAFAASLRHACVLRSDRTAWQDAEYAVQQLVEVTLHALSPALNEPFTAITCIDRLGQGLSVMATRRVPSAARTDRAHRIRVVAEPQSFSRLLRAAFDPIAVYVERTPEIYQRTLETLARVAQRARRADDRSAIRAQAGDILAAAHRHVADDRHRALIEALHARVVTAASGRRYASTLSGIPH